MFLQVSVIHSVHRGGVRGFIRGGVRGFIRGGMRGFIRGGACVVLFGGHAWFYSGGVRGFIRGGHAWFYLGGMRGFIRGACVVLFGGACMVLFGGAWFFQFFRIQWDTINERAVRILLECILVNRYFPCPWLKSALLPFERWHASCAFRLSHTRLKQ